MNISLPNFKDLFKDRDIVAEWNSRLNKNELPPINHLKQFKVDLTALHNLFKNIQLERVTEYEKSYIETLQDVDAGYSKRYYEGILTYPKTLAIEQQKQIDEIRKMTWHEHSASLSRKRILKSLKYLNEDYDPLVDERNYTELAPNLKGSYFEELRSLFKGRITRARFGNLKPGEGIRPHKDVIPQYACRIHIPLFTNEFSYSFAKKEDNLVVCQMKAGEVYMLNGGWTHWAHNFGTTDRIHLVMSVDGTEDYEG